MVGAQAAERKPRLWVWLKADDESYSVLCLGASGRCPRRDARWARGGEVPAADTGLRQQHGFPRVATGWKAIPLALSRAWKTGSEVGEGEEEERSRNVRAVTISMCSCVEVGKVLTPFRFVWGFHMLLHLLPTALMTGVVPTPQTGTQRPAVLRGWQGNVSVREEGTDACLPSPS